jgi:hypothetical protein
LDDELTFIPENSLESALDENITYQPDPQPFASISENKKSMIHIKKALMIFFCKKKEQLRVYIAKTDRGNH